jgi:hypothetical protein
LLLHITFPTQLVDCPFQVFALLFELFGIGFGFVELALSTFELLSVVIGHAFHVFDLSVVQLPFVHCVPPFLLHLLLQLLDFLQCQLRLPLRCHQFFVVFPRLDDSLLEVGFELLNFTLIDHTFPPLLRQRLLQVFDVTVPSQELVLCFIELPLLLLQNLLELADAVLVSRAFSPLVFQFILQKVNLVLCQFHLFRGLVKLVLLFVSLLLLLLQFLLQLLYGGFVDHTFLPLFVNLILQCSDFVGQGSVSLFFAIHDLHFLSQKVLQFLNCVLICVALPSLLFQLLAKKLYFLVVSLAFPLQLLHFLVRLVCMFDFLSQHTFQHFDFGFVDHAFPSLLVDDVLQLLYFVVVLLSPLFVVVDDLYFLA